MRLVWFYALIVTLLVGTAVGQVIDSDELQTKGNDIIDIEHYSVKSNHDIDNEKFPGLKYTKYEKEDSDESIGLFITHPSEEELILELELRAENALPEDIRSNNVFVTNNGYSVFWRSGEKLVEIIQNKRDNSETNPDENNEFDMGVVREILKKYPSDCSHKSCKSFAMTLKSIYSKFFKGHYQDRDLYTKYTDQIIWCKGRINHKEPTNEPDITFEEFKEDINRRYNGIPFSDEGMEDYYDTCASEGVVRIQPQPMTESFKECYEKVMEYIGESDLEVAHVKTIQYCDNIELITEEKSDFIEKDQEDVEQDLTNALIEQVVSDRIKFDRNRKTCEEGDSECGATGTEVSILVYCSEVGEEVCRNEETLDLGIEEAMQIPGIVIQYGDGSTMQVNSGGELVPFTKPIRTSGDSEEKTGYNP